MAGWSLDESKLEMVVYPISLLMILRVCQHYNPTILLH